MTLAVASANDAIGQERPSPAAPLAVAIAGPGGTLLVFRDTQGAARPAGRIYGPEPRPIEDGEAEVVNRLRDGVTRALPLTTSIVPRDGSFSFAELPPGTYRVALLRVIASSDADSCVQRSARSVGGLGITLNARGQMVSVRPSTPDGVFTEGGTHRQVVVVSERVETTSTRPVEVTLATSCGADRALPQPASAAPLGSVTAPSQPGPQAPQLPAQPQPGSSQCFPPCRAGFVCDGGRCVSACNPPCGLGEVCTPAAQCVSACNPPCLADQTCQGGQCIAAVATAGFQTSPGVFVGVAPPPPPDPGRELRLAARRALLLQASIRWHLDLVPDEGPGSFVSNAITLGLTLRKHFGPRIGIEGRPALLLGGWFVSFPECSECEIGGNTLGVDLGLAMVVASKGAFHWGPTTWIRYQSFGGRLTASDSSSYSTAGVSVASSVATFGGGLDLGVALGGREEGDLVFGFRFGREIGGEGSDFFITPLMVGLGYGLRVGAQASRDR